MSAEDIILIGVDGGGTGCRVSVGTPAQGILGEAKGGAANVSTNFVGSIENIVQTVRAALGDAQLTDVDLSQSVAHLGLAGADLKTTQDKTKAALPFGMACVSGDRQTSVAGALGPSDGFVVALGTGTIIARQKSGAVTTVGGWGFQLSDQASGAWLGRMLLTRTLLAGDGIADSSPLTDEILARLDGLKGLFAFSNTAVPRDYARFAPDIFTAGTRGDSIALALLREAARFLEQGLTTLGFSENDVLVLSGGVGPHFAPYLADKFKQDLRAPQGNALQGAFELARQLAVP